MQLNSQLSNLQHNHCRHFHFLIASMGTEKGRVLGGTVRNTIRAVNTNYVSANCGESTAATQQCVNWLLQVYRFVRLRLRWWHQHIYIFLCLYRYTHDGPGYGWKSFQGNLSYHLSINQVFPPKPRPGSDLCSFHVAIDLRGVVWVFQSGYLEKTLSTVTSPPPMEPVTGPEFCHYETY